MADTLSIYGKYAGMVGIKDATTHITLRKADFGEIATTAIANMDAVFTISASTGRITNTEAAVSFTIVSGDVGDVASMVSFDNTDGHYMLTVDLTSELTLTTAGTATLAVGDLQAIL